MEMGSLPSHFGSRGEKTSSLNTADKSCQKAWQTSSVLSSVLEYNEQILSGKTVRKRDGYQLRGSCHAVENVNTWSWQLGFKPQLRCLLTAWLQIHDFTFLTQLLPCAVSTITVPLSQFDIALKLMLVKHLDSAKCIINLSQILAIMIWVWMWQYVQAWAPSKSQLCCQWRRHNIWLSQNILMWLHPS